MLQYERYYAGDPVRVAAGCYNDYDVAPLLAMVKRALAAREASPISAAGARSAVPAAD
jgi:aromatic ring hydroxylase